MRAAPVPALEAGLVPGLGSGPGWHGQRWIPAPPKERPYMQEIERSPGRLRIAWPAEPSANRPVDPQVQAAYQ